MIRLRFKMYESNRNTYDSLPILAHSLVFYFLNNLRV